MKETPHTKRPGRRRPDTQARRHGARAGLRHALSGFVLMTLAAVFTTPATAAGEDESRPPI